MKNYEFAATCLFGLERLLGEEIDALGYTRTETIDGRVYFSAPTSAAARCNINLRFAERLFIVAGRFRAETFDMLFEGTRAIAWQSFISKGDAFPVKGHSIKSKLFSLPDCQKIVKKAVADRLSAEYNIPRLPETGTKYQIEFFILNDEAALMIDTSGAPLFKRGYRTEAGDAPLRETLAAALVALSRPREDVLLWDPFCGSGTIPIEAAMIMTNTAPGINRYFAAEDFRIVGKKAWAAAREEAKDRIKPTEFEAYGSDIDPECIEIAKANAERAGMSGRIKFFVRDALTIEKGDRRGTIVANPPYGERLSSVAECERLYKKMGAHFASLSPWQIYILCGNERFAECYGRRPDKVRKLYNGMIKCGFYQYFKNGK